MWTAHDVCRRSSDGQQGRDEAMCPWALRLTVTEEGGQCSRSTWEDGAALDRCGGCTTGERGESEGPGARVRPGLDWTQEDRLTRAMAHDGVVLGHVPTNQAHVGSALESTLCVMVCI